MAQDCTEQEAGHDQPLVRGNDLTLCRECVNVIVYGWCVFAVFFIGWLIGNAVQWIWKYLL